MAVPAIAAKGETGRAGEQQPPAAPGNFTARPAAGVGAGAGGALAHAEGSCRPGLAHGPPPAAVSAAAAAFSAAELPGVLPSPVLMLLSPVAAAELTAGGLLLVSTPSGAVCAVSVAISEGVSALCAGLLLFLAVARGLCWAAAACGYDAALSALLQSTAPVEAQQYATCRCKFRMHSLPMSTDRAR